MEGSVCPVHWLSLLHVRATRNLLSQVTHNELIACAWCWSGLVCAKDCSRAWFPTCTYTGLSHQLCFMKLARIMYGWVVLEICLLCLTLFLLITSPAAATACHNTEYGMSRKKWSRCWSTGEWQWTPVLGWFWMICSVMMMMSTWTWFPSDTLCAHWSIGWWNSSCGGTPITKRAHDNMTMSFLYIKMMLYCVACWAIVDFVAKLWSPSDADPG